MSLAEWHTFADEVIGEVGRQQHRVGGGGAAFFLVHFQRGDHFGIDREHELERIDRIKERRFVFLQVAVVGERQAFEVGEKVEQVADQASGLATGQLADIGIFFLWHQRRTGGVRVGKLNEGKFRRAPQDQILAEAREVSAAKRNRKEQLGHIITIGDGIHRVACDAVKTELRGDGLTVEVDGRSSQRAGAKRADVEALAAVGEAGFVALEHFDIGEKMVTGGDWLTALKVRVAGHHRSGEFFRAVEQGELEFGDGADDFADLAAAIQAGVGGDLVVARAGRVELGAGRADAASKLGLDVHVDVLKRGLELEFSLEDFLFDFPQAALDFLKLLGREESGILLRTRMGDRAGDVVRKQPPIVRNRFTKLLDERGGVLGEAAVPHGKWMIG